MKKSLTFLALTLLLAGCSRAPFTGDDAFRTESLRARIVETRVEVDDLGKFSWTAGDLIAVHRSASGYETAPLTEDGLFNVHLEEGEDRDAFAIYPAILADEAHSTASDLAVVLPSAYTIPVTGMGTYSPVPMVAKNDPASEDVQFHHLGGLLRVILERVPYETQKICVNFGKRVTGSFTVANPASSTPSISLDEGAAEDIVYTLESPVSGTANGFNLNIPLPKGNYTGADIKIYDRYDNLVCEESVTVDFAIGRAQGLRGDIDLTVDVTRIPVCMKMARQGTVTVKNPRNLTIEYSLDNENWTAFSSDLSLDLDRGEMVYFRGENASYGYEVDDNGDIVNGGNGYTNIRSSAKCYLFGNIMSLINPDPDVFSSLTELTAPYTFYELFSDDGEDGGNPIAPRMCSHPSIDLILPATTLTAHCYREMFEMSGIDRMVLPATQMKPYCYERMFNYCTRFVVPPVLPATELADYCYSYMFYRCGLKTAPELPATVMAMDCYGHMFDQCASLLEAPVIHATSLAKECFQGMFHSCISLSVAPDLPASSMAQDCYRSMFSNCVSLVTAPALSSTSLAHGCYREMFYNCTSLVTPPALPATVLDEYCYQKMFQKCSSLTTAPVLPALELAHNCYEGMFLDCTSLNYVKAMFTSFGIGSNSLENWLSGVSSTGTYVMNDAASYDAYNNGVPEGWTVERATE